MQETPSTLPPPENLPYLPHGIKDREQYFRKALGFLVRYEWLYNYPVTEILASGLLGQLPVDWWQPLSRLSLEDLKKLPRMDCQPQPDSDWPASLTDMVRACAALRLPVYDEPLPAAACIPDALRHVLTRGMSPKKHHEVLHLAAYISGRCVRDGVRCVVDVGCGIGYLCEVLHFVYGLRVVGLETDKTLVEKARLRHEDICRVLRVADTGGVRYVRCAVNASPEPVMDVLSDVMQDAGGPAPVCLVGLHSCGDLTPSAVQLFRSIPQITTLVLVTCCYHRMLVDGGRECAAKDAVAPGGELAVRYEEALQSQSEAREAGRARKVQLLLRWMREAGRTGTRVGPVPEEIQYLECLLTDGTATPEEVAAKAACQAQHTQQPEQMREHAKEWRGLEQPIAAGEPLQPRNPEPLPLSPGADPAELVRADLVAVLLKWLGPTGPLFGPRPAAAPEHFFMFPLSGELKRLARCCGGDQDTSQYTAARDAGVDGGLPGPLPLLAGDPLGHCAGFWACQVLRRPLLRLASNETAERWQSKEDPDFRYCSANLLSRAVYDLYAKEYGLLDESAIKKCLVPKVDPDGSLRFIVNATVDDQLPVGSAASEPVEVLRHRKGLAFVFAALEPLRPLLLSVVGLQTALQHVCEGLILLDRLAALMAALSDGVLGLPAPVGASASTASIVKVGDPMVTPRCYALVASKAKRPQAPCPQPGS